MRTWKCFCACAFALMGTLDASHAAAQPIGSDMHLDTWSAIPTQYIFRGLPQANEGLILQAGAEIRADFYDDDWFRVSVPISLFLSVHPGDKSEGVPNVPRAWYESRFDGGLILGFGGLDVDSRFTIYSSPNGSFEDVYEATFTLRYDDEAHWVEEGDAKAIWRGFHPHLVFARELIGARDYAVEGNYLELGLSPRAHVVEGGSLLGVDLVVPVAVGLSAGDYYEMPNADGVLVDQSLGFVSVGAVIDVEARFIPRRLGLWGGGLDFRLVLPVAANEASAGSPFAPGTNSAELVFRGYASIAF